jgi:protein disulfide-isomerase
MNRTFAAILFSLFFMLTAWDATAAGKVARPAIKPLPPLPAPSGSTTPAGWLDSYNSALTIASATNRPLLIFLTGSDWCGWCKRLRKDVLDTPAFKEFSNRNLVLLYVDSPHGVRLPAALTRHNETLKVMLRHRGGVPDTIILDPSGIRIGNISGYRQDFQQEVSRILKAAGFVPVE